MNYYLFIDFAIGLYISLNIGIDGLQNEYSLTIDNTAHLAAITEELKKYGTVETDENMCIICVVGDLRWGNVGFETLVTEALSHIPVRMISYGGSNHNISLLVREADKKIALETARINALTDPCMVFYNVSSSFNNYTFKQMMDMYVNTMDLDFVMTRDELKKAEKREFENDWAFYLNKKKDEGRFREDAP